MPRFALFLTVAAMCLRAWSSTPSPEALADAMRQALDAVSAHKLPMDAEAAARNIRLAVGRSADPKAQLLGAQEAAHLLEHAAGRDYHTGMRLTVSNGRPVVVDVAKGSPAQRALPPA